MTPYTKQTWQDYSPNYPVSAARMQHIEDGVYLSGTAVDGLQTSVQDLTAIAGTLTATTASLASSITTLNTTTTALDAAVRALQSKISPDAPICVSAPVLS